jgi:hypothetical protein
MPDNRDHEKRRDLYQKAYETAGQRMFDHGASMHGDDESFYDDNNNRVGSCGTCEELEKRQLIARNNLEAHIENHKL